MTSSLWELVLANDSLADLNDVERRLALRDLAIEAGAEDPGQEVRRIAEILDGVGPLTEFLDDPQVTDILVNGPDEVWIERGGELIRTGIRFDGERDLELLIERLLGRAGARADASCPIADARLPDGSRMHVVMTEVAPQGPLVSIRRHPEMPPSLADLLDRGSVTAEQHEVLIDLVSRGACIVIGGATGTGKTTLLGALLSEVPASERVVTIEEVAELRPRHPHIVSLVVRPPNVEGKGRVSAADLTRAALRMRPNRIVIGEVRGAEARVALHAMATGHRGSMLTVHASSSRDALERLVMLCVGEGWSEQTIRRALAMSVDAVIQLGIRDGRRVVTTIAVR